MTAQLLASELNNLIQESKRKHPDLRQASEKSLEELKTIKVTSEAQVAADLSQKVNFANPFIIACGTKNAKFTGIAIVCLQRLIVSRALPRSRLNQVLEALQQATSAGLDVQLKILQALPSLLSNYAADLKGELLVTALNICFILQSSKNAIVNNTSAATLQQLVVSVFDKVVAEDKAGSESPNVGEAPSEQGTVPLRAAALDAYRIFNDLCLLTESQRPEYLRFSGLTQTFGLELIESVLTNHAVIFSTHPEQAHILRTRVMPFIIGSLKEKPNFATTVRLVRILYTLLRRHISILPVESGDAMDILTQLLDQETATWKRALCMEVFRGIFSEPGLFRRIYFLYDSKEGQKPILKNLTATFVRVSTEKPSVIGLGPQSTIPVSNPYDSIGASTDQAMLAASGVTGIITGSVGSDGHNTGISTQWSTMRVPCIDQLDKTEPPTIPESYLYSLTLACITSLSEGLAKFILPLTVPSEGRKRSAKTAAQTQDTSTGRGVLERSASFKKNPVPTNPLLLEDHPLHLQVKICAAFINECWPAILATCSTFLYAALDSEYYHGLVRAFQKFTHVAGLLQLNTPRDAFLTTLGKAAVPPHVFTACLNAGSGTLRAPPATPDTPTNSIFSNARGLLSVDSLVSQSGQSGERPRQLSVDAGPSTLNTRNLLCLRALLNLGIALGPTLSSSWRIILETLQQADFVLFTTAKTAGRTPTATRMADQQADQEASVLLSNFGSEIKAVETAASRLFESTIDFPNSAFVEVVTAVCNLVEKRSNAPAEPSSRPQSPPSAASAASASPASALQTPRMPHRRQLSITTSASFTGLNQEIQFALAKLGDLASINLERLLSYSPEKSGWAPLTSELINTLGSSVNTAPVRLRAAETLVRFVMEASGVVSSQPEESRGRIQSRLLVAFRDALIPLQMDDRQLTFTNHSTDVDIHKVILEGLHGILENCGETLVSGWDISFDIIDSIFVSKGPGNKPLVARSVKLIRPSFASLELICSDFLSSLPNSCFLNLVDSLYKFCSQDDDLNVALTTVTFFWAISDFLSGRAESMPVTENMVNDRSDQTLLDLAADASHPGSGAALWVLLLLRLTSVATDQRLELRNSAIQTLLRIISAYGDSLSSEAWLISMRSVIFRLFTSIEDELRQVNSLSAKDKALSDWKDTASVVIQGVSGLFASHLNVLTALKSFTSVWKELLSHFATMLDFHILNVNAATFGAVRDILKQTVGTDNDGAGFTKGTIDLAWDLWSRDIPVPRNDKAEKPGDNQQCLLVWVETLLELYRLIKEDLDVERVRRMLTLLREAMDHATPGQYTSDVDYVTPLQGRILQVCKLVRTDIPGVPSAMITQVADFVSLAFVQESRQQTYVAMSKESMAILQSLIVKNATETDIYRTDAFASALSALAKPICLKYSFAVVSKSVQPWRKATTCFLEILEATLPHIRAEDMPRANFHSIWQIIVTIANGIISAECHRASPGSAVLEDQDFDIESFHRLRGLIIPTLGAESIPEKTRKAYAEAIFRTSIIHPPAPAESSIVYGNNGGEMVGLGALYQSRLGRTIDPAPSGRSKMSYVCLEELFSLLAAHGEEDKGALPASKGKPTNGNFTGSSKKPHSKKQEPTHELYVRLARTTALYLILRCALSIRAYIADQPLRGRMPQPLPQRKELSKILSCLVELRSEPDAIPDTANVDSEVRKHLLRLYPLLVSAVRVAGSSGDGPVLGLVGKALDVVGEELGV